ncbi:hypothetical protein BJ322DRAFT_507481 [Thelephora terrestris]|uniref:Uncharacterized protein n=1 Tax=Thelephora terrestris TaxID=56493 RepID=A0A9P6L1B9_9AGAM|nr:hypothetical protein BJ322DRAFT_507481 [Thelephora terrestris]
MPFSTDDSWPAGLLTIFEICRNKNKPLENRYYGPYDKLLNYCFGDSFTFFVAPQKYFDEDAVRDDGLDFIVFFIVFDADRRPVLMAGIKDDSWAGNASRRLQADEQLRDRYDIMFDTCALPRLWGLSLLGTSVRVYHGDVATRDVTPPYQPRPHESYNVPSGFLEGGWNICRYPFAGRIQQNEGDRCGYHHRHCCFVAVPL